jgi:hypothetical protein
LGSSHFRLKLDAIYRTTNLPGVDAVFVPLAIGSSGGFNRVGTSIGELQGLWSGGDGNVTVTIDRPLSDFEPLGDSEVNGNSQYQLEIGLGGAQLANGTPGSAFTVYFDNLRLEQISTPDLLKLTVNRQTKNAVLSNPSSNPISMSYYEIRSASGSLNKTNWTSIDDQEPNPDPVGTGFDEVPSSSNSLLAEVRAQLGSQGPLTINPGGSFNLGNIFAGTFDDQEDLIFQYRTPGRPLKLIGGPEGALDYAVAYTGTPLPIRPMGVSGDFNNNGTVDAADYSLWRDNLGAATEAPINNLGNGLNGVDAADYTLWRTRFNATTGASVASAGAVPEPSTLLLVAVGALVSLGGYRRER